MPSTVRRLNNNIRQICRDAQISFGTERTTTFVDSATRDPENIFTVCSAMHAYPGTVESQHDYERLKEYMLDHGVHRTQAPAKLTSNGNLAWVSDHYVKLMHFPNGINHTTIEDLPDFDPESARFSYTMTPDRNVMLEAFNCSEGSEEHFCQDPPSFPCKTLTTTEAAMATQACQQQDRARTSAVTNLLANIYNAIPRP